MSSRQQDAKDNVISVRLDGSSRVETRGVTASVREPRGRKQSNEPWQISQSAPSAFLSFSRRENVLSAVTVMVSFAAWQFPRLAFPFACGSWIICQPVSTHRQRERERERKEARKMNGKGEKRRQETFSPGQIGFSVIKIRILIARSIITA